MVYRRDQIPDFAAQQRQLLYFVSPRYVGPFQQLHATVFHALHHLGADEFVEYSPRCHIAAVATHQRFEGRLLTLQGQ